MWTNKRLLFIITVFILTLLTVSAGASTEPEGFNYKVVSLTYTPLNPEVGDIVTITAVVTLETSGNIRATDGITVADWWVDGQLAATRVTPRFAPGDTKELTHTLRGFTNIITVEFEINPKFTTSIQVDGRMHNSEWSTQDNRRAVEVRGGEGQIERDAPYSGDQGYQVDERYKGQSILERMIAGVIASITQGLYDIVGIVDPLVLIYDYEPYLLTEKQTDFQGRDQLHLGIYTDREMDVIGLLYKTFEAYLPIWLIISIVLAGFILVLAGFGGDQRTTAKQYVFGILVGFLLLIIGPVLVDFVFAIAYFNVDIVKGALNDLATNRGIELPKTMIGVLLLGLMKGGDGSYQGLIEQIPGITSIVYALMIFLIFFGAAILNWQYIVRKLTLAVLIFCLPIVAGLAVFPNTRGVLKIWFSEFFSNVFLVSAHAIVYGFLSAIALSGGSFRPIEILVFIMGLNGTTAIVRRMFGAPESSGARGAMGSMLGIGSMIALGKMTMGAKGGGLLGGGLSARGNGTPITPGGGNPAIPGGGGSSLSTEADMAKKVAMSGNNMTEREAASMGLEGGAFPLNEQPSTPGFWTKATTTGGAVALGTVGGLMSGLVTGKTSPGFAAGGIGGYKLGGYAASTAGNVKQAVANPGGMGIYDMSQVMDTKSAVNIGRNIGGTPGAAVGWAASKAARATRPAGYQIADATSRMTGDSPLTEGFYGAGNRADEFRTQIDDYYQNASAEYHSAGADLQLAQYRLQEHELSTPVENRKTSEYVQRQQELSDQKAEAERMFHLSRLAMRDAEHVKKNEHHYVGMGLEMNDLKRPPFKSNGGIT